MYRYRLGAYLLIVPMCKNPAKLTVNIHIIKTVLNPKLSTINEQFEDLKICQIAFLFPLVAFGRGFEIMHVSRWFILCLY
jgi:hypothetical protein